MFADRGRFNSENGRDLEIGFAAPEPREHFNFARGKRAVSDWPFRDCITVNFSRNLAPDFGQYTRTELEMIPHYKDPGRPNQQ